uniref:Ig-like domain-containing protein n=1 Tax=Glossina brevipalpis TaxID=37001 RepID=A0A1A9WLJ4_9MUSC
MNLTYLLLGLLVFASSSGSHARVIDDLDNSIEMVDEKPSSQAMLHARSRLGKDWIRFVKTPPGKIIQTMGSPVEIVCEIMASPIPTVQWVVGHLPLSEIDSIESNVISESSTTAVVKIRSVHIIDHMISEPRTYTCVGRTGSNTIYASTIVYPQADFKDLVQIREKPFRGPFRPRIVYSERIHMELVGSNVVLPCKVHARPRAEVTWLNVEGNRIEQSHRYKLLPSGDLLITKMKWEDMGVYKCIARNGMGKDSIDVFLYPVRNEDEDQ